MRPAAADTIVVSAAVGRFSPPPWSRVPLRFRPLLAAGALAGAALCLAAAPAAAQVVRGVARSAESLAPIAGVQVTLFDKQGRALAVVTSDSAGRFALRVPPATELDLRARRLGLAPSEAALKPLAPADTAELEFLMGDLAQTTDPVTVTAMGSLNDQRLNTARRRGWKLYEPEVVAQHRNRAQDFNQLLRSLGAPGILLPRSNNDCIRTMRDNRCLSFVLDNQVLGPTAIVLPSDIHFIAILSASESRIQFGDRAPWGAIAIYTRQREPGDARRRPRPTAPPVVTPPRPPTR